MMTGGIRFTGGGSSTFTTAGSFTVDDANRTTNTDVLTLTHTTTSALFGGAGMGVGILLRLEDSAGNVDNAIRLTAEWVTPTSGAEESQLVFSSRDQGAALAEFARLHRSVNTSSLFLTSGIFNNTAVQHDRFTGPGDGVLQDVINLLVEGTNVATFYQNDGVYFNDRLAVIESDAATNTVTTVLRLTHLTSGAAAAGYGVGMSFTGEDAGGNADDMGRISAEWSDATAGSEDSYLAFSYRVAGAALAEGTRFSPVTGLGHTVSDAATVTVSDVLTLTHLTSGAAGAAFGTGLLFQGEDSAGNTDNMGRLGFVWTDATSTSEDSAFVVEARRAGVALAEVMRVTGLGLSYARDGSAYNGLGSVVDMTASFNGDASFSITNGSAGGSADASFIAQNSGSDRLVALIYSSGVAGTQFGVTAARQGSVYTTTASSPLTMGTIAAATFTLGTNNIGRWQIGATSGDLTPFLTDTYSHGSSTLRMLEGWYGGRFHTAQGDSQASANDVTLGTGAAGGNYYKLTGNVNLQRIATAGWQAGDVVFIEFTGNPTVVRAVAAGGGFASILLAGGANLVIAAGTSTILPLVFDGTNFIQCAGVSQANA